MYIYIYIQVCISSVRCNNTTISVCDCMVWSVQIWLCDHTLPSWA